MGGGGEERTPHTTHHPTNLTCGWAAEPPVQLPGCPQRPYLTKGGQMVGRSDCVRRKGGKVWEGSKALVSGGLSLIQTRFGGRLFRTSSVTWGRAGGGRTSGTCLQLRAQKPLSGFCSSRPVLRGRHGAKPQAPQWQSAARLY